MNTPTYKEQFDKLTRAYINNEVNPFEDCACFVGNLLNRDRRWANGRCWSGERLFDEINSSRFRTIEGVTKVVYYEAGGLYTPNEILLLERKFLSSFKEGGGCYGGGGEWGGEDALFYAFEQTLELLKQIHISKGEIIDETPKFTKRELLKTI